MMASHRAMAHPGKDWKSFSHVALPVPTCGKLVVAEPAFSRPRETWVLLNEVVNVKFDRMPDGFRPSSLAFLALDSCQG